MRYKNLLIAYLIFLYSENIIANQPTQINTFPNVQSLKQNTPLKLVGKTRFSVLFWDIYQSQLKTSSGNYPVDREKESIFYEIQYLISISSENLIKNTIKQWQHIGLNADLYNIYIPALSAIWPDINKGDRLLLFIQAERSSFYFNGNYIGLIDTPEFGQLFLDIWLSDKTSEPKLKRELLGINE